ncbi:MAG: hypothetical protein KGD63_12175 [Candidatus Lokiarchaeota archaeon]|nr:hypothetical protein [Candidatus Lokiarchaeota archaeon]
MVNLIGMIDGILVTTIVILSILIGLLNILKSKAKFQKITGIVIICIGLVMLGPMLDFFALLFTNLNIDPWELIPVLSFIWIAPILVLGISMGAEAILPDKKKLLIIISAILGIIFEIIMFIGVFAENNGVFDTSETWVLGESLYNLRIVFEEVLGAAIIVSLIVCLAVILVINGIGFLQKAGESSGVIKKKFMLISLGWIAFIVFGVIDSVVDLGNMILIPRLFILLSVLCLYLGTKPS